MSSPSRLFRKSALARRGRPEALDGLLRVTAPHEWVILIGLAVGLAGVAAWSLFGSIDRALVAECLLVQSGERRAVVSGVSGNVVRVTVEPGDGVEAGQPIAYIQMPELSRDVALARARVVALEAAAEVAADRLILARAELAELEALQVSGEAVRSPYAGEVAVLDLTPGQAVEVGTAVGTIRSAATGAWEAIAFVSPDQAARLAAGMDAQVVPVAHRDSRSLSAQVQAVSSRPVVPADWRADFGPEASARRHTVRLSLHEEGLPQVTDGTPCNLRITLRRDSPLRLITSPGAD